MAVVLGIVIIKLSCSDNLGPQQVERESKNGASNEFSNKSRIVKQIKKTTDIGSAGIRAKTNFNLDPNCIKKQEKIYEEGYEKFSAVKTDAKDMYACKKNLINTLKDLVNNSRTISVAEQRQAFDLESFKNYPSYYFDTTGSGRAFAGASGTFMCCQPSLFVICELGSLYPFTRLK